MSDQVDNKTIDAPSEEVFEGLPKRKRSEDMEMDITPMIDVTFLLLIFFIVASKMDQQKAVELPGAHHGLAIVQKTSAILFVRRGESSDQVTVYAGEKQITGDLADQSIQIEDYVREELENNQKKQVLIMAEKGIKMRYFDHVRRAASN